MKTICIENNISSSIGGGIRFGDSSQIFTTYSGKEYSILRERNAERFGKEIVNLSKKQIGDILNEENNIQVVSNYGHNGICGFYQNIQDHPILTKAGFCQILSDYSSIQKYLPKFQIVEGRYITQSNIITKIKLGILQRFSIGEKIIIKHSLLDGNGEGTYLIEIDGNINQNIKKALDKFNLKLKDANRLLGVDYIIQEYIESKTLEGSITFNIQNEGFDNWGLVNNCVINGEYFASTNYFPSMNPNILKGLEKKIFTDFYELLNNLRKEGIRGNIGFDLIISSGKNKDDLNVYVLECNGLCRTTGSTLPNSFAYNSKNRLFLGIPLHVRYLLEEYQDLSENKLLKIEEILKKHGTKEGQDQIINFKCDGIEYNYPVVWIGVSGNNFNTLVQLIQNSEIMNKLGKNYISNIINPITDF